MQLLTPHFSLEEMQATSTGLPNVATASEIRHLRELCAGVLEPLREWWGPLRVTSGYRSPEVNRRVGGALRSAHRYGCAADVQPLARGVVVRDLWEWAARHLLADQVIWEKRGAVEWLHIGIAPPWLGSPRQQAFKQWR